jgi:alpha-tubulin suppressor-like RCC1 family protein
MRIASANFPGRLHLIALSLGALSTFCAREQRPPPAVTYVEMDNDAAALTTSPIADASVDAREADAGTDSEHSLPGIAGLSQGAEASHTCAITTEGETWCWGSNDYWCECSCEENRYGRNLLTAQRVRIPAKIAAVSLGARHSCALSTSRQLFCWGDNGLNEAVPVRGAHTMVPTEVQAVPEVEQVALGPNLTCAIVAGGDVLCWGANHDTDPFAKVLWVPTKVRGLAHASRISIGGESECAVLTDGTAWCWGTPLDGGPSYPVRRGSPTPKQVTGVSDAIDIAVGAEHACVLRRDKTIACWGGSDSMAEALGDGSQAHGRVAAKPVPNLHEVEQISAGLFHTCARQAGKVWCWGTNTEGEVGDGTKLPRTLPVQIPGIDDAVDVVCGSSHTCALTSGGRVLCWGSNRYGELGNGTLVASTAPVEVRTGTVSVDAGEPASPVPAVAPAQPPVEPPFSMTTTAPGSGAGAKNGNRLRVHYVGTLLTGTQFDSSRDRGQPFEFVLGRGTVIKGWEQGLLGMKVGERRKLVIPSSMAYGPQGRPGIPPYSTLVFDVELLAIEPK